MVHKRCRTVKAVAAHTPGYEAPLRIGTSARDVCLEVSTRHWRSSDRRPRLGLSTRTERAMWPPRYGRTGVRLGIAILFQALITIAIHSTAAISSLDSTLAACA
jgi:hypothetical protein